MDGEQQIKRAYESILDNDFEKAIELFEEAVSIEPDNAGYHYKLSITYARSNRLAKALQHAKTAHELEPDNEAYRFHLQHLEAKDLLEQAEGYFHNGPNQLHMAVALLRRAISLDPLSVEAHVMLGLAYGGLEDFGSAIQAVKEALRLDPQYEAAQVLLADLRQKMKKYMYSGPDTSERTR